MSKKSRKQQRRDRRQTQKKEKSKKKSTALNVFIIIITVLLLAVAGVGGYFFYIEYIKEPEENYIQTGTELMRQGAYQSAVEKYQQAIEEETRKQEEAERKAEEQGGTGQAGTEEGDRPPYVAQAYLGLGMAYYELQDYEQARTNLQTVVDIGGETTPVLYNLMGISCMKLEDYDGALSAFEQGTALSPQDTYVDEEGVEQSVDYSAVIQEMKFNRIICYEKKLDWAAAREAAESYIAAYPDDAAAQKEAEFLMK